MTQSPIALQAFCLTLAFGKRIPRWSALLFRRTILPAIALPIVVIWEVLKSPFVLAAAVKRFRKIGRRAQASEPKFDRASPGLN